MYRNDRRHVAAGGRRHQDRTANAARGAGERRIKSGRLSALLVGMVLVIARIRLPRWLLASLAIAALVMPIAAREKVLFMASGPNATEITGKNCSRSGGCGPVYAFW